MWRMHRAGAAGLAILLFGAPLGAQSAAPPARNPQLQRQLELAARELAKRAPAAKVTCGMTVVPADPKVDPQVIKPAPDRKTKPAIRRVKPGVCR